MLPFALYTPDNWKTPVPPVTFAIVKPCVDLSCVKQLALETGANVVHHIAVLCFSCRLAVVL